MNPAKIFEPPDIGTELLAVGATVASDVLLIRNGISRSQQLEVAEVCHLLNGQCDLVLLAVPPGEGVTVHHRVINLLGVEPEGQSGVATGPREAQREADVSAP